MKDEVTWELLRFVLYASGSVGFFVACALIWILKIRHDIYMSIADLRVLVAGLVQKDDLDLAKREINSRLDAHFNSETLRYSDVKEEIGELRSDINNLKKNHAGNR